MVLWMIRPNYHNLSLAWRATGDLMKEEEVLYWLFHHVDHEEIADVTDEMLGKLIANEPFLAVLFCECWADLSSSTIITEAFSLLLLILLSV